MIQHNPVRGLRGWRVAVHNGEVTLHSIVKSFQWDGPVVRNATPPADWNENLESSPDFGFFAFKASRQPQFIYRLDNPYYNNNFHVGVCNSATFVYGHVSMFGGVCEHEHGYRAQQMRIDRLALCSDTPRTADHFADEIRERYRCEVEVREHRGDIPSWLFDEPYVDDVHGWSGYWPLKYGKHWIGENDEFRIDSHFESIGRLPNANMGEIAHLSFHGSQQVVVPKTWHRYGVGLKGELRTDGSFRFQPKVVVGRKEAMRSIVLGLEDYEAPPLKPKRKRNPIREAAEKLNIARLY